jgi:hypothetical protein
VFTGWSPDAKSPPETGGAGTRLWAGFRPQTILGDHFQPSRRRVSPNPARFLPCSRSRHESGQGQSIGAPRQLLTDWPVRVPHPEPSTDGSPTAQAARKGECRHVQIRSIDSVPRRDQWSRRSSGASPPGFPIRRCPSRRAGRPLSGRHPSARPFGSQPAGRAQPSPAGSTIGVRRRRSVHF